MHSDVPNSESVNIDVCSWLLYMCLSVHRNAMLPGMGNFLHELKPSSHTITFCPKRTLKCTKQYFLFIFLTKKKTLKQAPVNN